MYTTEQIYQLYRKHQKVFTDSRLSADGGLFFALKGERFDGNDYALKAIADGAHYAVVDRKELADKSCCVFVEDVLKSLQYLANYHRRQLKIPILAITGTNGKTTTKELINSVLSQKFKVLATTGNLNNHIGVPLTLLKINDEHQIAVVEMGANHLSEIDFLCTIAEPDYGLITNVGKAHLEGFGSFEGVKKTKGELYNFIAKKGKAIFINTDNLHLLEMASGNHEKLTFATKNPSAQLKGDLANNDLFLVAKILFPKGWLYIKSKLTGSYNLENILAAARIGMHFNVDPLLIQKGIEGYEPQNNRSQVLTKNSSTILVDCYNANPSSMEVSIQNFIQIEKDNKILILGDMLELGDDSSVEHQKIVDRIEQSGIDEVYLVGAQFKQTKVPILFKMYLNVNELILDVKEKNWQNKFILIKGSRGIMLEKVIDVI